MNSGAQHTQGKAERRLCGSQSRWVFVTFSLQISTIFQGRCNPRIMAVELTDLLCLIIICRLFNRGLETPRTTKNQKLTTTKYLCRKKVCKTFVYLMELKTAQNNISCA